MSEQKSKPTAEDEERFKGELSSLDLALFEFAQKAWRAGFEIWVTDPDGSDFLLYGPGSSDPEFTLVRR